MLKEVERYIEKAPLNVQKILKKIRLIIKKDFGEGLEVMNYGVPGFKKDTKHFVLYAALKNHVGLYPHPSIIRHFEDELKPYKTSKGGIQFKLKDPIPYNLIEKISKHSFREK